VCITYSSIVSNLECLGSHIFSFFLTPFFFFVCSIPSVRCDYASLRGSNVALLSGDTTTPFAEVGLSFYRLPSYSQELNTWTAPLNGECLVYPPDIPIDGTWKFAKVCSFFALVFGGGGALFLWFSSCFVFGPGTWRWAGYEVLIASILQSLAFVFFNTAMCKTNGSHCSLFLGSKLDIVAAVFWLVSALSIFLKYPYPSPKLSTTTTGAASSSEMSIAGSSTTVPIQNTIPARSLEIL
jgi:hypothetical protein